METGLQPLGAPGCVMAARKYSAETTRRRLVLLLFSVHRVKFWKHCTARADLRKNAEIRENIVETANFLGLSQKEKLLQGSNFNSETKCPVEE